MRILVVSSLALFKRCPFCATLLDDIGTYWKCPNCGEYWTKIEEPEGPYGLRKNPDCKRPDPDTTCENCPVTTCPLLEKQDLSGD